MNNLLLYAFAAMKRRESFDSNHDVLDLAQATDRAPWWPLSNWPVGVDLGLIPSDFLREAAVFSGLLLAFLTLRHAVHRWTGPSAIDRPIFREGHARLVWLGRAFIVAVVVAAVATHSLRAAREAQLETARELVDQRQYQAGLEALARAEPWPSTTKPGRIDYVRAEAYAGTIGSLRKPITCAPIGRIGCISGQSPTSRSSMPPPMSL